MSYKKKILTGLVLATTVLGTTTSIVIPMVSGTNVVYANTVADAESERSLTLKKYAVSNLGEYQDRGDGETEAAPDYRPVEGAKYTIRKVEALPGKSLTNPQDQKEGVDYAFAGPEIQVTTDATGAVTHSFGIGTLNDGMYLVIESDDYSDIKIDGKTLEENKQHVVKPTDPFFVSIPQTSRTDNSSLVYEVIVEPKNVIDVDNAYELDKTIEGGKVHSDIAGKQFTWAANAKIPSGLYVITDTDLTISPVYDKEGNVITGNGTTGSGLEVVAGKVSIAKGDAYYADYFRVRDNIDPWLSLDAIAVNVTGGTEGTLVEGADYRVLIWNGTDYAEGYQLPMPSGIVKDVKIELTQAGMKKVTEQGNTDISVEFTTTAPTGYNTLLANYFEMEYLTPGAEPENPGTYPPGVTPPEPGEPTPPTIPGVTPPEPIDPPVLPPVDPEDPYEPPVQPPVLPPVDPDTPVDPEIPQYWTGGFDIEKTAKDTGNILAGAVFHIAESEEDAKAEMFLATDGNSYKLGSTLPSNVTLITAASDEQGRAEFDGLKLEALDRDGDGNITMGEIQYSYWVVETTAPEGYELAKAPYEVIISLNTHDEAFELDVIDEKQTDLPFTGGTGTTILVAIAVGAIVVGTTAIVMDKKRKSRLA